MSKNCALLTPQYFCRNDFDIEWYQNFDFYSTKDILTNFDTCVLSGAGDISPEMVDSSQSCLS